MRARRGCEGAGATGSGQGAQRPGSCRLTQDQVGSSWGVSTDRAQLRSQDLGQEEQRGSGC